MSALPKVIETVDLDEARRRAEVAAMMEQHHEIARARCRPHYDRMHAKARVARDELMVAIEALPQVIPADLVRKIEAYRQANFHLYRAAELVSDVEDLPEEGDGLTWEVKL